MASFHLNSIGSALPTQNDVLAGVDFSGKSLKLNTVKDAQPIVEAINACPNLQHLTLTGNTLGVEAAGAIAKALENHPELKVARFSDMFTGRLKTEIPPALSALGDGMIKAGARLVDLDLSDNAFGPIGVEGLAKLLQSDVCSKLQKLRLNNNGLGISGGKLLAKALSASPRKLEVFIAGRNRLENDGAIALAHVFQNMGTLREIAMPQNGIYHQGISALSEAFKRNPGLTHVNLNDNTIGTKGAGAFASALSKMKHLQDINFGDCLLKSKGAMALAKGLKENSINLTSLDLSCNEIGKEACMEVVDAITSTPDSDKRLNKVVLAGNALGGPASKQIMRDKLGNSAQLSDDDDSGDEDEEVASIDEKTEGSNSDDSDEENSEDSATEDAQHLDTSTASMGNPINLSEEHARGLGTTLSVVEEFLKNPTLENFANLGTNPVDALEEHVCMFQDPSLARECRIDALFCVSGLADKSPVAAEASRRLWRPVLRPSTETWPTINSLLRGFGLIKSENKDFKVRWWLPACYKVLASEIGAPYFPAAIRDTLKLFIANNMTKFPPEVCDVINKHASVYR